MNSMTGYGSAKGIAQGLSLSVEIRSVNNRFLDISIRLPKGFLFAEDTIKSQIQDRITRGKLDVFLNLEHPEGEQTRVHVNDELVSSYHEALKSISEKEGLPCVLTAVDLSRFPEVLVLEKPEVDKEKFLSELRPVVSAALDDFNRMRSYEGSRLKEDLLEKAEHIESLVENIEEKAPQTLAFYRSRLEEKMSEILHDSSIAEERILMEAAVFSDRIATDEELVRLRSHLSQFRSMIQSGSPIGRKLDFLIQEFNREANTIGSKCQDTEIAYLVVDLKAEIEKIREQIQNIE